jgi:hypothetical protein
MDSIDGALNNIIQLFEPLYLMFLIFVNSVLMDLFFEFVIMFSEADLLLTYSTIVRRASKAVLIGGGGGLVGVSLSYSPLV